MNFFNGPSRAINGTLYNSSMFATKTTTSTSALKGIGGNAKNCKYNGQSISSENGQISYASGIGSASDKCIAIVDGIIYSNGYVSRAGGIASGSGVKSASNLITVADEIRAMQSSSAEPTYAGDIIGYDETKFTLENVFTNSSCTVSAVNTGDSKSAYAINSGVRRTLAQIKRASFLKTVFSLEYQSLAYLEEDPEAVWIIKDGEYPELYFTVLKDITVSDVEHGTISVDKTQAVDDEIVTVTAVPDEGYKLNKIYVNGEEITGTTFTVAGDSDVYATFAEIPAEYRVSVAANANATAGLVNVDTVSLQSVSLFSDNQALTATDGEEIKVNTQAAADYTVDAIYVNGEELAGDSFIVTDDSVVTMDAVSISTDVKATTNDAANVGSYYATLSGSVEGDNATKYIRYWSTSNPSEIYTTAAEEGDGAYSVTVSDLELGTEYQFQMTEYGEVKSFTTSEAEPDGEGVPDSAYDGGNTLAEPTPTYDYPAFEIKNQQVGTDSISLDIQNNADDTMAGTLIIAAYDSSDSLITVKTKAVANIPQDTSKSFDVDVPEAAYYKLFIWKDINSMLPMADSVVVR